ncbi:MAG: hypothetical protein IPI00_06610 [Flavobacteriales bacterium]|nr:hypothetical protein [Flavobacteriales bacterium]MBK6943626.1 hypothetical protein [Flavobacteriales bacterium]MBK7239837.1 hypothetical protein [Flavobacteriales bacterium]MBK7297167.1 hypothetical protein [Flavobacteriales bacterium]MBK9535846.1 hypothetical protein [Flavobacteriales bacterium]
MNIATTKLELVQQLLSIADEKTLRKVANFFKKEVPVVAEEDDITDEEYAEFEEMRSKRDTGEVKFLTEKEAKEEIARLIAAERK